MDLVAIEEVAAVLAKHGVVGTVTIELPTRAYIKLLTDADAHCRYPQRPHVSVEAAAPNRAPKIFPDITVNTTQITIVVRPRCKVTL